MAGSSFVRRAVLLAGKYIRVYKTNTGESRMDVLEDTVIGGVSNNLSESVINDITENVVGKFTIEDLSAQLVSGTPGIITSEAFIEGKILVYYNGQNITPDITVTGNNSFDVDNYYSDEYLENDTLLAVFFFN